ncbi:MAG: glycosyltransferase [Terrimicrobiaceae bacterium]|nr:glycosyltransferase [Terrimicrobiaceae bacterium]
MDSAPTPRPTCLLVIPSYRDSERLATFAAHLAGGLPKEFSIQVVDDGSGPGEAEKLAEIARHVNQSAGPDSAKLLFPLRFQSNRGKGAAVRLGWSICDNFDLAGFTDADGAVGTEEILRGYRHLTQHLDTTDGILASRVRMLGRKIERSLLRHLSGRVFSTAVSVTSRLPAYDTQCGFKLFKSSSIAEVLPRLQSNRFAFDVELILELRCAGAQLHEFPVDWHHQAGSKVSLLRDALPMLLDVWRTSRRISGRGHCG